MIIPLGTDSRLRNTPYMNWALIAANVFVFVIIQHLHRDVSGHISLDLSSPDELFASRFDLSPRDPSLWTFITYAFLHANWMHLIGNMLFLWIFGNNVNDKMGHVGYLGFYLAGGVFAGIAYVLLQHTSAAVLGASGAIAAVTGAVPGSLPPFAHHDLLHVVFLREVSLPASGSFSSFSPRTCF